MSGLYLLGVIALWLWLTWLLGRELRKWWQKEEAHWGLRAGVAIVIGSLWLGVSFWYAGGRKIYYDWQVERLCAIDGGIRVYEQVRLPAEEFDRWGMPKMYQERVENKAAYQHDKAGTVMEFVMKRSTDPAHLGDIRGEEYLLRSETTYYRRGDPEMWHTHVQITRKGDGKILGESRRYSRRGGHMPGPWHASSFACPREAGREALIRSVFITDKGTGRSR